MTLKDLQVADLYNFMDELDGILHNPHFNSYPFNYRMGVKRMRTYLDHVASGFRMMNGGRFEPHCIMDLHFHKRENDKD